MDARDMLKQEALAAIQELERDVLGGQNRPMVVAALAVIFAKEKKTEFSAWVASKKAGATVPQDELTTGTWGILKRTLFG